MKYVMLVSVNRDNMWYKGLPSVHEAVFAVEPTPYEYGGFTGKLYRIVSKEHKGAGLHPEDVIITTEEHFLKYKTLTLNK